MPGSTAAALVFLCFNRKRRVFVVEETSDLHKRELLKYHAYFPILVFEGVINLGIFSNFLYQCRPCLSWTVGKGPIVAGELRRIWVLPSP